ncbi:hypothetical protein CEXT_419851, partial [Caerostris extrusa]
MTSLPYLIEKWSDLDDCFWRPRHFAHSKKDAGGKFEKICFNIPKSSDQISRVALVLGMLVGVAGDREYLPGQHIFAFNLQLRERFSRAENTSR